MKVTYALILSAVFSCAASWTEAAPILQFSDNMDGTISLQVVTDDVGSLGAEVAVELSATPGLILTDVTVNTLLFDTPNPGDNPFIAGSPVGGDSMGLWTDFPNNRAFASFGTGNPGIGTFDFLTLSFEGVGEFQAFGLVAQAGQLNDGLFANFTVVPEPTAIAALVGCLLTVAGRSRRVAGF